MNEETKKSRRGFGAMSEEKRKEIASKGGRSVPREKRYYSVNKQVAITAGSLGGKAPRRKKGTIDAE